MTNTDSYNKTNKNTNITQNKNKQISYKHFSVKIHVNKFTLFILTENIYSY